MKINNRQNPVILMILLCGLAFTNYAQAPNNNFSQLRFSIETTKNWFVLSEQIPIVLKVKNESNAAIPGSVDFSAKVKRIKFFAEKPNKSVIEVEPYRMYSGTCTNCQRKYPLLPNFSFQTRDAVQNFVENVFALEGDYKVWAEICDRECNDPNTQKVISNQITFKIFEPQGKDSEAYQKFKELLKYDWYFANKQDVTYLQMAEEFLSKYEGTPYSDYVADKATQYFSQIGQFQKADNYYQKITLNYVFRNEAYIQRRRMEHELSKK